MFCRINDLKNKTVINVRNGAKLGYMADAEIDTASALMSTIVIKGRWRLWGLLGREEDIIIRWSDIEVIGEDTILVNHTLPSGEANSKKNGWFRILSDE